MNPAVNSTTLLGALLGLGVGLGLLLTLTGWRGVDTQRPRQRLWRRPDQRLDHRATVRRLLAAGVAVLTGVATGWIVGAVLAGLAAWALPRLWGADPDHARRIARIEAIATWTEMLRDTLAAAAGLEQAILATAPLTPAAIRDEITDLAARLEHGQRLAPSLRALAERLADPTADLVISSLVLASEHQARQLGDLLSSLAHAAREQASMRMRIEAGRARTRTSVRVIVGTTLVFAAGLVLFNRSYLAAYDSLTGQLVLLVIGALFTFGFAWLVRVAQINQPTRFLAPSPQITSAHDIGTTTPAGQR